MSIAIKPELEAKILRLVERGVYPDSNAVLDAAIASLEDARLADLRAKLQIGIDQLERGETVEWTARLMDELFENARQRAARGEMPHPDVCP